MPAPKKRTPASKLPKKQPAAPTPTPTPQPTWSRPPDPGARIERHRIAVDEAEENLKEYRRWRRQAEERSKLLETLAPIAGEDNIAFTRALAASRSREAILGTQGDLWVKRRGMLEHLTDTEASLLQALPRVLDVVNLSTADRERICSLALKGFLVLRQRMDLGDVPMLHLERSPEADAKLEDPWWIPDP